MQQLACLHLLPFCGPSVNAKVFSYPCSIVAAARSNAAASGVL